MRRGLAGIEPTPARPNGAGYARLNLSATSYMYYVNLHYLYHKMLYIFKIELK